MHYIQRIRSWLCGHQWASLLGIVLPLMMLHLVLKTVRIMDRGQSVSLIEVFDLYKSELLLHAGMAVLGLAILGIIARRWLKHSVLAGLQLGAVSVALLEITAHRFYVGTGSTLDFYLFSFALTEFEESWAVIASEVPVGTFVLMGVASVGLLTGPWLLMWLSRFLKTRREGAGSAAATAIPRAGALTRGPLAPAWLGTVAVGTLLIAVSGMPPFVVTNVGFARASTMNMALSFLEKLRTYDGIESGRTPLTQVDLKPRKAYKSAPTKNVAIILLESTRARSVSFQNPELDTTPFLAELAKTSLVADRAYTVVPHTSKALVASLCGIEPRLNMPITESLPDALPVRCLANLLAGRGYETAFFQSATEAFEGRRQLVQNMGYETFVPLEEMNKRGFQKANYFGKEDDIMLAPSEEWLRGLEADKPFLTTYLTLTPHHDYLAPDRYGLLEFDEDEEVNRYLNSIRYVDFFVRNLIDQYKELGLYENTIFVVLGDHGEGFGEHGRRQHDNVIYEEGVHIPLLIHVPGEFEGGVRVETPVSQIDVLPTVTDLLGYDITGGIFPGVSMLNPDPDRTVYAHCWYERRCMASITTDDKFIHHFGGQPDEFFDLAADPLELADLANERTDIGLRRMQLMSWRAQVNGMYRVHNEGRLDEFILDEEPEVQHPLNVHFGDYVRLLGYDVSTDSVRPGQRFYVTYYFEALKKIPAKWNLFVHGVGTGKMRNLDHVPVNGLYPLEDWKPGEFIVNVQEVHVPRNWRPGSFNLLIGIYHPEDGRAEVRGDIETDGDNRATVVVMPVVR